jgi:hypothetical protein
MQPSYLTPASASKFLLAAFVRGFAQKVKAEICPMQVFVEQSRFAANSLF